MNHLKKVFTLSLILLLQPFNAKADTLDNIMLVGIATLTVGVLFLSNEAVKVIQKMVYIQQQRQVKLEELEKALTEINKNLQNMKTQLSRPQK